jgi:hypothetical protein
LIGRVNASAKEKDKKSLVIHYEGTGDSVKRRRSVGLWEQFYDDVLVCCYLGVLLEIKVVEI